MEAIPTFYRYRQYSALNGRFTSRDPIYYDGGIGLYAYCNNNGINKNDPYGKVYQEVGVIVVGGLLVIAAYVAVTHVIKQTGGNAHMPKTPAEQARVKSINDKLPDKVCRAKL